MIEYVKCFKKVYVCRTYRANSSISLIIISKRNDCSETFESWISCLLGDDFGMVTRFHFAHSILTSVGRSWVLGMVIRVGNYRVLHRLLNLKGFKSLAQYNHVVHLILSASFSWTVSDALNWVVRDSCICSCGDLAYCRVGHASLEDSYHKTVKLKRHENST